MKRIIILLMLLSAAGFVSASFVQYYRADWSGTVSLNDTALCFYDGTCVDGNAASYDLDIAGDSGTGVITNVETFTIAGGTGISTVMSGNTLTITNTGGSGGGNTTEEMQDAVMSAIDDGTQTGITVTYDDANNDMDFVVTVTDTNCSGATCDIANTGTLDGYDGAALDDWDSYSDFMGTTTAGKICRWDGTEIDCDYTDQVGSGGLFGDGIYLYNSSGTMYLNESKLNITIDARDDDTTYTADEGNITLSGTTFKLKKLDLAEHTNSLGWITDGNTNWDNTYDFYSGTQVNSSCDARDDDTQLTEDQVEAYIFDTDNTANLPMNGYNITGITSMTFISGGKICTG